MRLYFSFTFDTKKLGLSVLIGERERNDLVGYGYDSAPILMYFKVHIICVELILGNLFISK